MARERFEKRALTGTINVACKFDDGTVRHWNADKADVIEKIKYIVNEYSKEGYILTLRQLHYQLVAQNWIVNHTTAYQKLSGILDDCRYAGIIDWDAIEDRGRIPYIPYQVNNVTHALQDAVDTYRINLQEGQEKHVELWTEKDALSGILRRTTAKYHVRLVVNKGYTSSSALYNAYERCVESICAGQQVVILYFGDHDPSGLDMVRDIQDRLTTFLTRGNKLERNEGFDKQYEDWWRTLGPSDAELVYSYDLDLKVANRLIEGRATDNDWDDFYAAKKRYYIRTHELFKVVPIGLTMEQIKKYKLPPNPAKMTDSRADKYIKKFGKTCWEVDALKPQVLTSIVESNIQENIDISLFNKMVVRQEKDIKELASFIKKRKK